MRFEGKTVIVTGGASGVGEYTSKKFAQEGAKVVVNCLPGHPEGQKVVDEIIAAGGTAICAPADVRKEDDVKRMIQTAIDTFGKVDIFVSNAGVFDGYKPLLEQSEEVWDNVMATNLKGNFFCMRNIIPHMIENGGGVIVITDSIAGLIGGHGGAAYTASKHGLNGLAKQITFDYGHLGIRCNTVCPGTLYTPMTKDLLDGNEAAREKISRTPYGDYGKPKHVGDMILFLASDEAEFIHGVNYLVDGGNTVRKWK